MFVLIWIHISTYTQTASSFTKSTDEPNKNGMELEYRMILTSGISPNFISLLFSILVIIFWNNNAVGIDFCMTGYYFEWLSILYSTKDQRYTFYMFYSFLKLLHIFFGSTDSSVRSSSAIEHGYTN